MSDLSPLDFSVWSVLETTTNKTSHSNLKALQHAIREAWDDMSKEYIRNSCTSVRHRIEAVIDNIGGHIE
ncbi:Uncharacterized protein FKW44_024100 [Caligus rogercresseyi]|uniref:Uncharacterized protein n=1 Tax=Caligus rogercresseyi TaxID=217165 RepID=A0A7T8GMF0_CALRO|nr:Uncharacterized protein FKW44_024100 [Caligus rogercresseyi]